MIEINLLPKELRKKKIEIPKIEFMPIILGALILILSIQFLLFATLKIKKGGLGRMEAKWELLEPERKEISALKRKINSLSNRIRSIETIKGDAILWARKLNDLSDSMIPGVWLNQLSLTETPEEGYLSIKGSVSSFGRDETAVIGKFMKGLKENKSFFKDFDEIELGTIQQKASGDMEIMDFSINCYLKD
jgi:Tfp pilus assembly protein PilN